MRFLPSPTVLWFVIGFVILPSCKFKKQYRNNAQKQLFRSLFNGSATPCISKKVSPKKQSQKPRILVFTSCGGGGHTSAAHALQSYLGEQYEVHVTQMFGEVLAELDPIRFLSAKKIDCESLYNFCLQRGFAWGVGMYSSLGKWITHLCMDLMEERIEEYLLLHQPDMVISVIPFVNGAIYTATTRLGLPFSVITVDLNTVNYLHGLYAPQSPLFMYCLPFNEPMMHNVLEYTHMPATSVRCVGFPVRSSFLALTKERSRLRRELCLPQDKPIIMVLMGASGSTAVLSYARQLAKVTVPFHVLFCVGRNHRLATQLHTMNFPHHMSISVIRFTDKIPELMKASDLLITKPGPTTICEAMHAQLPMLLDYTSRLLFWEKMNVDFVTEYEFGQVISSLHNIPDTVQQLITHPDELRKFAQNIGLFILSPVEEKIKELVSEMLQRKVLCEHEFENEMRQQHKEH